MRARVFEGTPTVESCIRVAGTNGGSAEAKARASRRLERGAAVLLVAAVALTSVVAYGARSAPVPLSIAAVQAKQILPQPQALLIRVAVQKRAVPRRRLSGFEKLLGSAGLNVEALLRDMRKTPPGEGGPYIALEDVRFPRLDHERLDRLKRLAKDLPLGSPLEDYQLSGAFGARIDPINHRPAFHPGLDMVAPYRSMVHSTGKGAVIFAGSIAGYGRVVEIDHGHGIVTRYAHLHRILVAKGQTVEPHTAIGEVGSTGRSTGPHLHYEIRVSGVPLDPGKFIRIGENAVEGVPAGSKAVPDTRASFSRKGAP